MLGVVGLKCCVRLHGVPGRQRNYFEAMDIFESVGLSFTRRRHEHWTNTVRIRQNLRSHTNILHTDLEQNWTPWPPDAILAFTSAEVTLCRALVILRLLLFYWGTQLKPLWRREAFLYGVYFFRKNTVSPRRSYNFKWQYIYVVVNFYLR